MPIKSIPDNQGWSAGGYNFYVAENGTLSKGRPGETPTQITGSLADGASIGGVVYFNRPTKPTERSAGVPLVIGDRWYNTSDGTEWFWNGTYWVSFATYTFSTPSATIFAAGNSLVTTGVPDNNWICEQAYIYYSQLGGGGTNVWSPTDYFTISLDLGKIDSTDFVSMVQGSTVSSRGGYTSSTPTVRLSTNSQTALRIFCSAEVNDPVNGSVYGTLILRKLYV